MRLTLEETGRENGLAWLEATLPPQAEATRIGYRSRTGALLRVDGVAAGAYDREHDGVVLPPSDRERRLRLEVELASLPTNGLPSGPGPVWWFLNAIAHQRPATALSVEPAAYGAVRERSGDLPLLGHSHLDVAWLWTYEQTHRKAERTFAIACDLLDRDPAFVFIQSQPQLYSFVAERDEALFERVRAHVANGRLDPDVAALWVESDCNVPSGESLLRQMLFAHAYCKDAFGTEPRIAWLPDTFGFANTLPQLLAHAGIPYFATTKLMWNDTTRFPYAQFAWEGPDGSGVVAALIQSYDGPAYPWRVARARERSEPLVLGYGDGGGGVTEKMLDSARSLGPWITPRSWFASLQARRDSLPRWRDELYLEYHRGVYTTHHDVKAHNALLERALGEAEELVAWCLAVHAPRAAVEQLAQRIQAAWRIVLRNQFHDVLPGTSIEPVYEDVLQEYAAAEELAASVISAAQSMLPRGREHAARARRTTPAFEEDAYVFDNGFVHARVRANGTVVELAANDGRNVCTQGNVLALYEDKPRQWEAWNVDASYAKRVRRAIPGPHRLEDGALQVEFRLGGSPATMRVSLFEGEPFLRVDLDVDWRERRTLLRVENWFALHADRFACGAPHGIVERVTTATTPAERAKFEVPGQRFAAVRETGGAGATVFALDTYGWNARALPGGGVRLGHSLLRGTSWPDPHADLGHHRLSYAFAPLRNAGNGALERAWLLFAHDGRVPLFACDDEAVLVAACKPAEDGDGAIVRVRECDGAARAVRLRCAARMTAAISVDALERPLDLPVAIESEDVSFDLAPYQLRSFRVRFSHES